MVQFGSGGKSVADALGEKLGIPVYDHELIIKAAQDSGFSAELFVQSDEKKRFFSLSSIFAGSYSTDTENYMSDKACSRCSAKPSGRLLQKALP